MNTHTGSRKKAIGYIRVSTEDQEKGGMSLYRQAATIREAAKVAGFELVGIYGDTGSGMGLHSADRRPELQVVIKKAKQEGLKIIVVGMDRLSRNIVTAESLIRDEALDVISVKKDETNDLRLLEIAVRKAEEEGREISRSTRAALNKLREDGKKLGNPASLPVATQRSLRVRQLRSHEVVLEVADFLQSHPEHAEKKVPELVDLLNLAGIKTGWGRQWTPSALRRPLEAARRELAVQKELSADDFDDVAKPPAEDPGQVGNRGNYSAEELESLKLIPNFGMF